MGGLVFKIRAKRGAIEVGHEKLLRDKGYLKGGVLLEREGGRFSKLFHHFSFFCLVNIYACCNQ